ncbi:MAG TPA: phosphatase PAP2 family protein [Streptosporangiaceae bacterium]
MTSLTEHILGVSGSVLLVVWVALLAAAALLFWRPNLTPGRPAWLAARLRTGAPTGLALTAALLTLAACAWSLALLTFSVVHHTGIAHDDPRVLAFVTGHRTPWLTSFARVLTWLGSAFVLWPVAILAGLGLWRWRRQWLPAVLPALALAGAGAWSVLIKVLVGQPRPPVSLRLGTFHSWAYPSQHAAQALATWGMLALMLMAGRSARARALLAAGAALIAFVVGLTRLYLAAHWMTDVLGGWALAGVWDSLLIICYLLAPRAAVPRGRPAQAAVYRKAA